MDNNGENVGIIYVMSSAINGLVKIGSTNSFNQRMNLLENNGYWNVTCLKRVLGIEINQYKEKEVMIRKIFEKARIGNSELYALDVDLVVQLLSSFDGKVIYPVDESTQDIFIESKDKLEGKNIYIPDGEYLLKRKVNNEEVVGNLRVINEKIVSNDESEEVSLVKYILLKGSILSKLDKTTVKKYRKNREQAKKDGNVLKEDIKCDSPSEAVSIVVGANANGWSEWKNSKGESIDIYRK